MKKLARFFAVAVALCGAGARAQDLSGNWQGTLHWHGDRRVIVKFAEGRRTGGPRRYTTTPMMGNRRSMRRRW